VTKVLCQLEKIPSSNTYLSEKTYLNVFIDGEIEGEPLRKTLKPQNLLLSEHTDNNLKLKMILILKLLL
jgi:hypothetical protein